MKLTLNAERIEKIKNVVIGSTVSYGCCDYFSTKRVVKWSNKISNLLFDKDTKKFVIRGLGHTLSLRDLFTEIYLSNRYKTTSKALRDLSNKYYLCNKSNLENEFYEYIDNLGEAQFKIQNVNLNETDVEWLNNHVVNITAEFPKKYLKNFKEHFGNAEYKLRNNTWNYSFTMYFNNMEDIPESLLKVTNSEGNTLDYDHKKMNNTSYIWHLIKNNSDKFNFGKRKV